MCADSLVVCLYVWGSFDPFLKQVLYVLQRLAAYHFVQITLEGLDPEAEAGSSQFHQIHAQPFPVSWLCSLQPCSTHVSLASERVWELPLTPVSGA